MISASAARKGSEKLEGSMMLPRTVLPGTSSWCSCRLKVNGPTQCHLCIAGVTECGTAPASCACCMAAYLHIYDLIVDI